MADLFALIWGKCWLIWFEGWGDVADPVIVVWGLMGFVPLGYE